MNLLITGSRGFIGNYFRRKYGEKHNISTFSFQNNDFNALDLTKTNTILHLSALVHQMDGASKEEYFKINVDNTMTLAKKAKKHGVRHFIFMSSVKVYGEENDTPYTETTLCKPEDDYGKSKLEAENQLRMLEEETFTISIIRTPIVYGYGVKANIQNLIQLVNRVPVLPFGGIGNRRSMVYIGNLCKMIDKICETQQSGIFLAGDDTPVSTTKLIELIAKESHKNIHLVNIPFFASLLKLLKPSFHKRLYESLEVDNQQTKKTLNMQNPYSVEEGIHYMIHGETI
jgi:UDP-glucose 4-epimerase